MSEHILAWLGAYHDGELHGRRLAQVEGHLAECETCRAELDELRALRSLLASSLPAELPTPPERFVAQMGLRLPRRPAQPAWQRALERGWQMVPLGLLGAWAVVQAAFILTTGAVLAWRLGLGESLTGDWLPAWSAGPGLAESLSLSGAGLRDAASLGWRLVSGGGPLGWGLVLYLGVQVAMGLLYWSWLASWWAYRQHRLRFAGPSVVSIDPIL